LEEIWKQYFSTAKGKAEILSPKNPEFRLFAKYTLLKEMALGFQLC